VLAGSASTEYVYEQTAVKLNLPFENLSVEVTDYILHQPIEGDLVRNVNFLPIN
jgi:hypothetical protein